MTSAGRNHSSARVRVLVSGDCASCDRAIEVVAAVRRVRPDMAVDLIDVDVDGVPDDIAFVGTPMYVWGDRVISLGNPAPQDLLTILEGARP